MASTSARRVRAAVWVSEPNAAWEPTISSLRAGHPEVEVVVAGPDRATRESLAAVADQVLGAHDLAELVDGAGQGGAHVLVIHAPCVLPPGFLDPGLDLIEADPRCASVSFLSAASGAASFEPTAPAGGSAASITAQLRARRQGLEPVAVAYPTGPAVLLSERGLSLLRPFPSHSIRAPLALADYGAAGRARGLLDLLDPTTYLEVDPGGPGGLAPEELRWLRAAHPALAMSLDASEERDAALGEVMALVRAEIDGLRILMDGYCLMPEEMGTQVAFLSLLAALVERDDVAYLGVALPGYMPEYARAVLAHPKIDARQCDLATLDGFEDVDVIHRPYQILAGLDMSRWRSVARRITVTMHDTIAYQIPAYFESPAAWLAHRHATRTLARQVDGLIAVSEDAGAQMRRERLAGPERIFVAANGVDHLRGDERAVEPVALRRSGFAGEPFLVVLGTNYSHKNRDVMIEVARALRQRGHHLHLVLAGANVPHGSSARAEAERLAPGDAVHVIPDVTSEERNWLLRHAAVVLYPTAAEGFGLVPHEAAAFGTPTVMTPIPALAERFAGLPVLAVDWSVEAYVRAVESLLADPQVAAAQVRAISALAQRYSWQRTAESLLEAFRSLLARPAVGTL
jgi:glycosyltransferase involved in cell wall biosynthesis